MADPKVQIRRSSVPGKIPTTSQLSLGELAVNTYDGKVYIEQDQGGVGVGTTVIVVNPWSVGTGTNTYNTYFTNGNVGIGSTTPTSSLYVVGDTYITGILTANRIFSTIYGEFTGGSISGTEIVGTGLSISGISTLGTVQISSGIITATSGVVTYYGDGSNLTGVIASSAVSLQNSRTFEITGDVVASAVSFNGTGNVSLAATIQPNSVSLGTDTTGDYVTSISGTSNQITVSNGTGEGSTPTVAISNNPTIPGNVTITNDLQVNNNLNVTGNITIGGTSAYIVSNDFRVKDADIVVGYTTDSNGNDVSNDTTANHGGIAVASTEGSPLVQLYNVSIGETNPATYKKIMWFKSGAFTGLNTDAWLINYAVGIGSTQVPSGVYLAAGDVQFTDRDLIKVRNINSSGVITATTFVGSLTGTATTATNLADAANITTGTINSARLSGNYSINITGTATTATNVIGGIGSLSALTVSGITTTGNLQVGTGGTIVTTTTSGLVGIGTTNPSQTLHVQGNFRLTGGLYDTNNIVGVAGSVLTSTGAGVSWSASTGGGGLTITDDTSTNATRYILFDDNTSGSISAANVSSTKLQFNPSTGTLSATVFTSLSDESKKENIRTIKNPTEITKRLRGVKFNWKNNHKDSMGLIAQEVEAILPEVVNTDENGIKSLNYSSLIGLLIETIKEQQVRIENLEKKIDA